jgi:hypothetical protein
MNRLLPCPGCARHVRAGEIRCPFCDGPLTSVAPVRRTRPAGRLSRAALFAAGATLMSAAGCGSDTVGGADGAGVQRDASGDGDVADRAATDGDDDTFNPVPIYGAAINGGAVLDKGLAPKKK